MFARLDSIRETRDLKVDESSSIGYHRLFDGGRFQKLSQL